jgi:hypothetical protein
LSDTDDYKLDVTIDPVPVDAISASQLDGSFSSRVFYYSACRPATIKLIPKPGSGNPVTASVIVADPSWLETVALPAKGKIISGASCGASSTSDSANLPTAFDYINALMSQAKAVNDAFKKKTTTAASSK